MDGQAHEPRSLGAARSGAAHATPSGVSSARLPPPPFRYKEKVLHEALRAAAWRQGAPWTGLAACHVEIMQRALRRFAVGTYAGPIWREEGTRPRSDEDTAVVSTPKREAAARTSSRANEAAKSLAGHHGLSGRQSATGAALVVFNKARRGNGKALLTEFQLAHPGGGRGGWGMISPRPASGTSGKGDNNGSI